MKHFWNRHPEKKPSAQKDAMTEIFKARKVFMGK